MSTSVVPLRLVFKTDEALQILFICRFVKLVDVRIYKDFVTSLSALAAMGVVLSHMAEAALIDYIPH